MTQPHHVLIVEDDPATAEDLTEIVDAIGCTSVVVDNRDDALLSLRSQRFCFVLLDLQIKGSGKAIKAHVEHGKSFLRALRQSHGEHHGPVYRLPVLVLSGHAREANEAVEVMKDGADDVIQKPLNSRQVSERIRRVLEASGRASHKLCDDPPPAKLSHEEGGIVIAIPGERIGRRTRVMVGSTAVKLTDGALRVLLHLMVAHRRGEWLNKVMLGTAPDEGFKGISRLTEQLGPALADRNIIENDRHGNYRLVAEVTIGAVGRLDEIGDATISRLAAELRKV
ncbi:MAG TPA: response regulator [Thermoanaerobaculia bacterium]|nr:response regulator [Thermoanaerobaculia bacterium]